MFIPVILGTAREGRRSENVAKYILEQVKLNGFETELVDVRNYLLSHTDNTGKTEMAQKYSDIIKRADALVIVSPEYNHGYPGELKIMLDMAYKEYADKPVGFCGASIGPFGGVRVVEQLRQVVVELHMIPVREAVYFGNVGTLFSETGEIADKNYVDRVKTFLADLSSKVR